MMNYYSREVGGIELVCGSMYSGKTEYLIRQMQRYYWAGWNIRVFRASALPIQAPARQRALTSHDGSQIEATYINKSSQILPLLPASTNAVAIDEVQFLDWGIADVCQILADRGVRMIASGLDMNFRGEPFGPIPLLISIADQVRKMKAICEVCGHSGSRSQRLMHGRLAPYDDPVILLGAQFYQPRCRHCHRVPGRD